MDGLGNPVPSLDDPGRSRFHVMDPVERKKRLREQGERREEAVPSLARAVASVSLSDESRLLDALRRELEGIQDPAERRRIVDAWSTSLARRGLEDETEARRLGERVLRDLETPDGPAPPAPFKW